VYVDFDVGISTERNHGSRCGPHQEIFKTQLKKTSTMSNTPTTKKLIISRKYIPRVKCTLDHARSVACAGAAELIVSETRKFVDKLRQELLSRIRMEIKLLMLRVAKKERMVYKKKTRVAKFDNIGLSWQQDSSIGNCKILFVVLYGWFDINLGWAKNIEDKLMKDMKLEYDEVGGDKRGDIGCIEWLINHCKRELVKLINARSSTSHGMKITITRKRGTINTENRFKKRQKGAFYADFVKGASQMLSSSTASQKAPPTAHSDGDDSAEFNDNNSDRDSDLESDGNNEDTDKDILEVVTIKKTPSERELEREMTRMAAAIRKEDAEHKKDRRSVVIDAATKVITSATKVAAKRMAATKVAARKSAEDPPPSKYEKKRLRRVWRNNNRLNELNLLKPDQKEAFGKTVAPDDTSSDESGGEEEDADDDSEDEIIEIKEKKVEDGTVRLKVRWSTGATMWADEANVKIDEPEMVARFYAASTMVSATSRPSKKARAELEMIEKRGACSGGHSSCEDFTIEEDSRYWNEGNSFHNVKCGKCEGESRPTSKVLSYCCRQWSTHGCIELRCCRCFSNMLTSEGAGVRRSRSSIITTV
jgi:hypothetical protein